MITTRVYQEDLELKKLLSKSKAERPQFDWRAVACGETANGAASFKVRVLDEHRDFDLGEIADTIGNALTDLLLARNKDATDIFSEENQERVRSFSLKVANCTSRRRKWRTELGDHRHGRAHGAGHLPRHRGRAGAAERARCGAQRDRAAPAF